MRGLNFIRVLLYQTINIATLTGISIESIESVIKMHLLTCEVNNSSSCQINAQPYRFPDYEIEIKISLQARIKHLTKAKTCVCTPFPRHSLSLRKKTLRCSAKNRSTNDLFSTGKQTLHENSASKPAKRKKKLTVEPFTNDTVRILDEHHMQSHHSTSTYSSLTNRCTINLQTTNQFSDLHSSTKNNLFLLLMSAFSFAMKNIPELKKQLQNALKR